MEKGTVTYAPDELLIDVQVQSAATCHDGKQVGLVQANFDRRTASKGQYIDVLTIFDVETVKAVVADGEEIECGGRILGTKHNPTYSI